MKNFHLLLYIKDSWVWLPDAYCSSYDHGLLPSLWIVRIYTCVQYWDSYVNVSLEEYKWASLIQDFSIIHCIFGKVLFGILVFGFFFFEFYFRLFACYFICFWFWFFLNLLFCHVFVLDYQCDSYWRQCFKLKTSKELGIMHCTWGLLLWMSLGNSIWFYATGKFPILKF